MDNPVVRFAVIGLWIGVTVCEIYGLYLSAQESSGSFMLALALPPWAMFKGFMGFI